MEVENVEQWKGQAVVDRDGEAVGKVDEVLVDRRTGEPSLIAVKIGRLRSHVVLVPLSGASLARDHVRLPHSKEAIEAAPEVDPAAVRREDELLLGRHYGVTVPDARGAADDEPRYETSTEVKAREAAAATALAEAERLEAEAERRQGEVVAGQAAAAQATEKADAAEEERRRLVADAEALRAGAADRGAGS